ncbi:MAG: alpha-amylase family glycosyl hydrolase, partial [Deinococcota bacterium]|nr:alpha-amylase family glycosyl hydrolase [Deinococcota bacterium]
GGEALLSRLLRGLDFLKEEAKQSFFGPGPSPVLDQEALAGRRMAGPGGFAAGSVSEAYGAGVLDPASLKEPEYERFSADLSWMPRLVLMAKSTYVWLGQLSERYGRDIHRLDQVPDEELDRLAAQGFTGLWLIGLWERSHASKVIKQLMGNPDAVASAYSLYDYVIAHDLGGDEAFENLKSRAWQRGVRLASDMVPNHVGVDGRWVIEHPDWFVSVDQPPFPSYTFNGPDLSQDERVGIFLEDHYYDHSDAAVVFRRLDRHSGDSLYIYHGNDGTSMAWNDTAQLDYLKAEVREAVIQTILFVARKFSVIRFDAAMTLAKEHIQRLWYPHPGTGGDIASRAEHGLTKAEFDKLMPAEFWREVVDRVAQEVPDTLLLAEAFWMMEGYFVRTLGMHRVYNSAFMHMLKKEESDKYRQLIKNTLEFDPEILKRYVNFMNNPDEETAVAQFGKDDKYFGVCTVMSTLPGLPMFGHGQLEGLHEKYGMEYRRAKWQETPDQQLVKRHEREIFPLLHKRYLFAEVDNFLLYDFHAEGGYVVEDVFAYSNRAGGERALVVFNNKFAEAKGWIKESSAFAVKSAEGKALERRSLAEGLALGGDERFVICRDGIGGLEYLRSAGGLRRDGLYLELGAFKYAVFMDFREVEGEDYGRLMVRLGGRGVASVDREKRALAVEPLVQAFREVVSGERYRRLKAAFDEETGAEAVDEGTLEPQLRVLLEQVGRTGGVDLDAPARSGELASELGELVETMIKLRRSLQGGAAEEAVTLPQAVFYSALNLVFLRAVEPLAEAVPEAEKADVWLEHW